MKRYLIPVRRLKNVQLYNKIAGWITHKAGSPIVSIIAFLVVIPWGITGPFFGFSDSWQLVNTGTTVITFLMVFIIQQSQNKDTAAIHLKLNELIASNEKASNRLVDIEELTDEELLVLRDYYISLADKAEKELDPHSSHSLDEAEENHNLKLRSIKRK